MTIIPFGRTPEERRRNADLAGAKARHPAGSQITPEEAAAVARPKWASQRYRNAEERRAALMAAKACKGKDCERVFDYRHGGLPPPDGLCGECRRRSRTTEPPAPPPDPSLF